MRIRILPTNSLFAAAADHVIEIGRQAVSARGSFSIALSGGNTPQALYEELASHCRQDQFDWSSTDFFWSDERCVAPDHVDSNYRLAYEAFLSKLPIEKNRVYPMPADSLDLDAAARSYEQLLSRQVMHRQTATPTLDLVLLGMGVDGHTASLFPHTSALTETDRWVVGNEVPQLATWRLTMTPPLINNAANVLFLVTGREKAATLAEVLNGTEDPDRLPSQLIRPLHTIATWLIDDEAAEQL